jgi:probable F420-dependent oxidoreductase
VRVGIAAFNLPSVELLDLGVAAEEFGFDTLWLGEHVLHPIGHRSSHPLSGSVSRAHGGPSVGDASEFQDLFVALGALAGATSRIELATGIAVAPFRHPLLTALSAVTLDEVSGGRFTLGVGAGWLREEFEALNVSYAERFSLLEEDIAIYRRAFEAKPFSHEGKHWRFDSVQLARRPVSIPIIMGGNTERALQRAAQLGDGWFVSGDLELDDMCRLIARVRELRREDGGIEEFRCILRTLDVTRDAFRRLEAAGVPEVALWFRSLWPSGTLAEKRTALGRAARAFGL